MLTTTYINIYKTVKFTIYVSILYVYHPEEGHLIGRMMKVVIVQI